MKTRLAAALVAAVLVAAGACGGDEPPLRVSAAASLREPLTRYGGTEGVPTAFSFAGSDELAAQIRRGGRPDVFASADARLPRQLFGAGLVERPVAFAGNRLVLAVPAGEGRVRSLAGAGARRVKLVVGADGVPIGAYTREVLGRLPRGLARAIRANVRSREPDVKGIVAKLAQRAGDAGFVYATDVEAAQGRLRAIELPAAVQPRVAYAAAVVKGGDRIADARAFVAGLLRGRARQALLDAGFEPPPP